MEKIHTENRLLLIGSFTEKGGVNLEVTINKMTAKQAMEISKALIARLTVLVFKNVIRNITEPRDNSFKPDMNKFSNN